MNIAKKCEFCNKEWIPKDRYGIKYKRYCSVSCSNRGDPRRKGININLLERDKEIVKGLYLKDKKCINEISKTYNCTGTILKKFLIKEGALLRSTNPRKYRKTYLKFS